jgi:hypothetical protein
MLKKLRFVTGRGWDDQNCFVFLECLHRCLANAGVQPEIDVVAY